MDTSLEYILQCEKAEEIQECFHTLSLLPPGTFWVRKSGGGGVTGYNYKRLPEWIILPRQDQLQEMIGDYEKCIDLIGWYNETITPDIGQFEPSSMEQLWLAFVMSEKYGKAWSGTEWVK